MGQQQDTIVALSSGQLPSGVAIIRASGECASELLTTFGIKVPNARFAKFSKLLSPIDQTIIDEGLVLYFPAPNSFSGEDLVELQLHGSRAVVQFVLDQATKLENVRLAEPGEFTRRAFENGKLDLTSVEGIADLIEAQTESQRAMAVSRMRGNLNAVLVDWRIQITKLRAGIEANLDFSDEDDVPFELPTHFIEDIQRLSAEITKKLDRFDQGRMVREGVRVALVGRPNVGKSSLLNALARSDVAIVTDIPGTTRDVVSVDVNLDGILFSFFDTAGVRDTEDLVEKLGIERSLSSAENADIVIGLTDDGALPDGMVFDYVVATKADSRETHSPEFEYACEVSVKTNDGLSDFVQLLLNSVEKDNDSRETMLISHMRDKLALTAALEALDRASKMLYAPELLAEELRTASFSLSRLIGDVGTEDVLDELFSGFCIGK
ncbi:tRNA uridine-5-carboxymethylaminomethyl(34) synthesis GTPase MnmE [Maritalea sp.]|uniref:tRNA uridine-5-carboxymethylaminomethyl(34) synthesis GTPase MnmE n=1 Tax=Maritalea sp. TaxID=2003361 RepID=UPI003EF2FF17